MKKPNELTGGVPVKGSEEMDAALCLEVFNSYIRDCRKAIRAQSRMQVTLNADGKSSHLVFESKNLTLTLNAI